MKKIVYILSILLVYATITYGQGISMTIGTKTSNVGDTVTVPVSVSNFNNIGAVSLKMQYNASVLSYIGVSDQPSAGNLTENASDGVLTIGWFNTTPLNLGNGKFLNMKFIYKGGSSDINFIPAACEVANISGTVLVVEYNNGKVSAEGAGSTIRLPEVEAIAGNQVSVPLVFENFQNLGAVSLKINYDTNVLTYNGVSGQPAAGNFTANADNGVITIGWFDTTPLNIDSAKFIDIKFIYNGGISNLSFNTPQCEISSSTGSSIFTQYVDGKIYPDPSTVASVMLADITAGSGEEVVVPVTLKNISNIGAVSLKIQYDPIVLDFKSVENSLTTGNFTATGDNGVITIGWFDTNPIAGESVKLADIKFQYKSGTSALSFETAQCEVASVLGVVQSVQYVNGSVKQTEGSEAKVSIGTVKGTIGEDVVVPFSVENFNNIGAISFKVNFDQSKLVYKGVENQPSEGNFTANAENGVLTIGWFNTTALSISNGKLLDVKFGYQGGTSSLTFDLTQCEVSTVSGTNVTVVYQNGVVSPLAEPVFTLFNVKGVAGQSIKIPIIAQKLVNIGAISLKVNYDPAVLTYEGTESAPSEGNFTANADNGILTLGWFNTTAMNADSIKFVDVKFYYNGGNSDVTFAVNDCEIANLAGTVINAVYVDGSVVPESNTNPKLTIANVATSVGQTVLVPVSALNIENVGAVSLKIQYNSSVLSYVGTENQPTAGNFTANAENGLVTLGWFDTTPIVLNQGNLVTLKFTYNGGNSAVEFVTDQCELAKTDGSIISFVEYVNGSVQGNEPPAFTVFPVDTIKIKEDSLFTYEFKAVDPNAGAVLTYSLTVAPKGAAINSSTGAFSWKPDFTQSGKYNMTVKVTDGVLEASLVVPILVINNNRSPVFTAVMPDQTVEYTSSGGENPTYTYNTVMFQYKASDPDAGTKLVYSVVTVPAITKNFIFYPTTGLFRWKPEPGDQNTYVFYLTVSDGIVSITDTAVVTVPTAVGVDNESEIPTEYSLMQNFPNPFNPTTKIKYALPQESKVVLSVYNLLGQRLSILVDEVKPAGNHFVEFNASNLPTGFYIYKIEAENYTSVKKMILMK